MLMQWGGVVGGVVSQMLWKWGVVGWGGQPNVDAVGCGGLGWSVKCWCSGVWWVGVVGQLLMQWGVVWSSTVGGGC